MTICILIQWSKDRSIFDSENNPMCPKCGMPAEEIIGFFGELCYAHKVTK